MGGWLSRDSSSTLSTADAHHLGRKCKTLATAYSKCHKANPNDPKACNNLQTSLVMCYAADLCKQASDAHQKCYMSVINTGYYQGRRTCEPEVNALKQCLTKYKLYPFDI